MGQGLQAQAWAGAIPEGMSVSLGIEGAVQQGWRDRAVWGAKAEPCWLLTPPLLWGLG